MRQDESSELLPDTSIYNLAGFYSPIPPAGFQYHKLTGPDPSGYCGQSSQFMHFTKLSPISVNSTYHISEIQPYSPALGCLMPSSSLAIASSLVLPKDTASHSLCKTFQ